MPRHSGASRARRSQQATPPFCATHPVALGSTARSGDAARSDPSCAIYRQEMEQEMRHFVWLLVSAYSRALRQRGEMLRQIVVEVETIGDSRTMFRLRIDANVIAEGLTAAQAHLLVGEILDRFTLPKRDGRASVGSAPSRWRGFGVNSGNGP